MLSSSLLLTRRFAASQVKRRFLSDVTGSIPGGSSGPAIVRRKVSLAERAQLRAARKERASRLLQQNSQGTAAAGSTTSSSTNSSRTARLSFMSRYMWHIGLGVPTILLLWGISDENSPPVKLAEAIGITSLVGFVMDQFSKPKSDKLLPDWSEIANVPHDMPQPITLVLDIEKTLVSSTWDRKHGWRHAKRPGVDKFLFDMSQYFEIVFFSPSLDVVAGPVMRALDSRGLVIHNLFREATYYTNGVHVKDLSCLNRDLKRIVVLDDDPEEVQFHLDNLIRIKPFEDATDFSDRSLARITPFLIEIAREDCHDIPGLLRQYRGMDADQIAEEYENRLGKYSEERTKHMKRRVVGFLVKDNSLPPPELAPVDPYLTVTPSLTSKDLVGPAPNNDLEKPGLLGRFNRHAKAKEESQQIRNQQINEWYYKKQMEKHEAEKRAKQEAAHSS